MSTPSNEMIAEVMLYSEGFAHAKALDVARRDLRSRQRNSPQQHYDWGLRALKTVLCVGGQLVAAQTRGSAALDEAEEAMLVIQALRVGTLSKLTHGDTAAFNALVGVFPTPSRRTSLMTTRGGAQGDDGPQLPSHDPHLTPHIPSSIHR